MILIHHFQNFRGKQTVIFAIFTTNCWMTILASHRNTEHQLSNVVLRPKLLRQEPPWCLRKKDLQKHSFVFMQYHNHSSRQLSSSRHMQCSASRGSPSRLTYQTPAYPVWHLSGLAVRTETISIWA